MNDDKITAIQHSPLNFLTCTVLNMAPTLQLDFSMGKWVPNIIFEDIGDLLLEIEDWVMYLVTRELS